MKRTLISLILATTLATTILTGCEPLVVDPLDKRYEVDGVATTARQLFEAGKEDFDYSKYILCDGSYHYYDKSKRVSNDGSVTYYDHYDLKNGTFTYSRYYVDDDNKLSIYSGEFKDELNFNLAPSVSKDKRKKDSVKVSLYKKTQDGEETQFYQYDGNKNDEIFIDVEAIFPENFNGINTIVSRSTEKGKNMLDVTLSGDVSFLRHVFGSGCYGYQYAKNVRYSFCLDDNKLKEIVVFGDKFQDKKVSSGGVESRASEVNITIKFSEMSNEPVEIPEPPTIMSENDDINRILTGDEEFIVSEGIENPANCRDDFCKDAVHIWEELMALPEEDRNTLTKISDQLADIAITHEYYDYTCTYALLEKDICVVRFSFFDYVGKPMGYIFVPFQCKIDNDKKDQTIVGSAFCASGADTIEIGSEGGFSFDHKDDYEKKHHYKYWLDKYMNLEIGYRAYKLERLSLLKKDEELEEFVEESRSELKRLGEEYRLPVLSDITEYYLNKYDETYYVVNIHMDEEYTIGIMRDYDLNIVYEDEMKSKLAYLDRKETEVSWVQISDE